MAYVYRLKVDGTLRYIGKGSCGRAYEWERTVRRIVRKRQADVPLHPVREPQWARSLADAWLDGAKVEVEIVVDGLSHEDALAMERAEIAACAGKGIWNAAGVTDEDIYRRVAARNTGQKRTPEQRAKMSAAQKGKTKSAAHRKAMSEAAARRAQTEEGKAHFARISKLGHAASRRLH